MRFLVLTLLVVAGAAFAGWWNRALPPPALGELAPDPPIQTSVAPGEVPDWTSHDVHFRALARYTLKARILCTTPYYFDGLSSIGCNLDLGVAWGRMSDPAIYERVNISPVERGLRFTSKGSDVIPDDEIRVSIANTHVIPANLSVLAELFTFHRGDVAELSGYLIGARPSSGGEEAVSSLSRDDVGTHACEIMWVTSARHVDP